MPGTPCWQHLKCGRERECPAYPDRGFDCWNVEATMCRGERQGKYGDKVRYCRDICEYYDGVISGRIKVT